MLGLVLNRIRLRKPHDKPHFEPALISGVPLCSCDCPRCSITLPDGYRLVCICLGCNARECGLHRSP